MASLRNQIYIGSKTDPTFYFENESILTVNGTLAVNLVGEELSIDTLTPNVIFEVRSPEIFVPTDYDGIETSDDLILSGHYTSDLGDLAWGTPVWYYNNENYIGKYYIDSVERVGKYQYQLNCVSIIGVLDKQQFYGDVYSGEKFENVAKSILLTNGLQKYRGTTYVRTEGQSRILSLTKVLCGTDSVSAHFYYEGIDGTGAGGTSDIACFLGFRDDYGNEKSYAVIADITRDSESSAWNQSIEPKLLYGTQTIMSGVTVSPNTDVYIEVDGENGVFTVNGNEVSFTPESFGYGHVPAILGMWYSTGETTYNTYNPAMQCRFYEFEATDSAGDKKMDVIPAYPAFSITSPGVYDKLKRVFVAPKLNDNVNMTKGTDVIVDLPDFVDFTATQEGSKVSVAFADGVAEQLVYGWIPSGSKRDALYQLLFAHNVNIRKAEDDAILFSWIYQATPEAISDDCIYLDGSIDYGEKVREVDVTEHIFGDGTGESVTLYDNSSGEAVNNAIVTFSDAPIDEAFMFPTGTIKVIARGPNAVMVSGVGKLSSYKRLHNQSIVKRINTSITDGSTITVSEAYLVGTNNSENVADRMYEYYTKNRKINNAIVLDGQSCGKCYSFNDPFDEPCSAYLQEMTFDSTSIVKANCEFVADYTPVTGENNYSNYVLLTGDGVWTVPEEVLEKTTPRIRVILMSGGQGGSSGYAGKSGYQQPARSIYTHEPYAGGSGGASGDGGRVLSVTIDNPASQYAYSCGVGGAGGAINYSSTSTNAGELGADTAFGSYSTSAGATVNQVYNFFTGAKYACKSYTGHSGGSGGCPTSGTCSSYWYSYGGDAYGYDGIYTGGTGGATGGGFGGGAAAGQNGSNGSGNNGGKGADATAQTFTPGNRAKGGRGGAGGGTGGDSGVNGSGTPGAGGYGGPGSQGDSGCILIYY